MMMGPQPEYQCVFRMHPDPLQWLWDGVNDFQTKFDDLRTRAIRNFKRLVDVAQHDVHCGLTIHKTKCLALAAKEH